MKNYSQDRKRHLAGYKEEKEISLLNGTWRGIPYPHILPKEEYKRNILEVIRDDFWNYQTNEIELHKDFHHLNSSQALCFNLFFPLFNKDNLFLSEFIIRKIEISTAVKNDYEMLEKPFEKLNDFEIAVLDKKKLELNRILNCQFEYIPDKEEFTNFDFHVQLINGSEIFFEVKYTENGFGKAAKDKRHLDKIKSTYNPRLAGKIKDKFINDDFILENYQVLRNISYAEKDKKTVVFLIPKENETLKNGGSMEAFLEQILVPDLREFVKVVYLEDLVSSILNDKNFSNLSDVYAEFHRKYIA